MYYDNLDDEVLQRGLVRIGRVICGKEPHSLEVNSMHSRRTLHIKSLCAQHECLFEWAVCRVRGAATAGVIGIL